MRRVGALAPLWHHVPVPRLPRLPRRIALPTSRRGRLVLVVVAAVAVVLVGLLLPGVSALVNGYAAQRTVSGAVATLRTGDLDGAREGLEAARDDVDDMRRSAQGATGTAWGWLPGGDADRADVRRLAAALDELLSVMGTAVDAHPAESTAEGFILMPDGSIDVGGLSAVLSETDAYQRLLGSARSELDAVTGDGFFGPALGYARNAALARVVPMDEALARVEPFVPLVPRMLGADGPRTYLVASLNPAELRFSGGATLSFAAIEVDDGDISQGDPLNGMDKGLFDRLRWPRVEGNPFHRAGARLRLSTATLAPSWSVAGEELARAYEAVTGTPVDGVVALDVVALQDLMQFTGPIEVSGYGLLDSTNLVEELVGSYDDLTSVDAFLDRRAGSAQLMSVFQSQLMSPSQLAGKFDSLVASSRSRHAAVHFRDDEVQEVFEDAGFEGDLSRTRNDYVGVFNQATTGHKADYWQRRTVTSDVHLRADGSARVRLDIELYNDSPPPAEDVFMSFRNYVRRDNDTSLAAFLPTGAHVRSVELDGVGKDVDTEDFYGRPFVRVRFTAEAQETRHLVVEYDVDHAAVRRAGSLLYRLDVDPQGMVDPEALDVTVHWPEGHTAESLPDGWTATEDGARCATGDLTTSSRWEIEVAPG